MALTPSFKVEFWRGKQGLPRYGTNVLKQELNRGFAKKIVDLR